jgi:hypothetical protein
MLDEVAEIAEVLRTPPPPTTTSPDSSLSAEQTHAAALLLLIFQGYLLDYPACDDMWFCATIPLISRACKSVAERAALPLHLQVYLATDGRARRFAKWLHQKNRAKHVATLQLQVSKWYSRDCRSPKTSSTTNGLIMIAKALSQPQAPAAAVLQSPSVAAHSHTTAQTVGPQGNELAVASTRPEGHTAGSISSSSTDTGGLPSNSSSSKLPSNPQLPSPVSSTNLLPGSSLQKLDLVDASVLSDPAIFTSFLPLLRRVPHLTLSWSRLVASADTPRYPGEFPDEQRQELIRQKEVLKILLQAGVPRKAFQFY